MKYLKSSMSRFIFFTFISLLLLAQPAAAQKVPINFNDYHGYTGTVNYIKSVARAYPEITKLIQIGKSTMGRPIYVLVVTYMKNGTTLDRYVKLQNMRKEGVKNVPPMPAHMGKPGHWICGSTHGNEYTGTEVCLYTINKLVTGYGAKEEITDLLKKVTFYICPVVNPDGLYNSIEKGISQRQNSMKLDNDKDGKINEDGPDDLNGDGHITYFRIKDAKGQYVIDDKDPRIMVRLRRGQQSSKPRYSLYREDKDNDGDGKRGEDSEAGIDLNRNYPEGWTRPDGMNGGTGDYPTSSPEVHAMAEFFTWHTNILMAQNFHTSGGFTYRPMGTAPHTQMHPKDVAIFDFIMGKKYLEIIGEEVPAAWKSIANINRFKEELKKTSKNKYAISRGYELPRGWRVSYSEARDRRYGYGMASDWMYQQLGIYATTTELWNPARDIEGFPQLSGPSARAQREAALLKYQDENYQGKLFVPWKKFRHPDLGEGEIGGWIPKYTGNALPGKPLIGVCEKHWQFELFRAGLLPQIVISEAKARVLYTSNSARAATASASGDQVTINKGKSKGKYKIIEVTATLENRGKLATHLARGARLAGNREDVVWLIGDPKKVTFLQETRFQKLGVMEGTIRMPAFRMQAAPGSQSGRMPRMMMPGMPMRFRRGSSLSPTQVRQTGPKRQVKWLIAVEGNTPLKVVVSSQKGGTQVRDLAVK